MKYNLNFIVIYFLLSILFLSFLSFLLDNKNKRLNKGIKTLIFNLNIFIVFSIGLVYGLYTNNWNMNGTFIINIIVVLSFIILVMILRNEYLKNKEISYKYNLLEDYLKTSTELLEKYSVTIHKYKNNLIAIKGYMNDNQNDANLYIDKLLENFKTKKYKWLKDVNYIQIEVIKYLIYYKLVAAEDLGLKINITVSSDLKKLKTLNLDIENNNILLEVLGEYFDNAIMASKESLKRELNISLYVENNDLVFMIANTYNNKIEITRLEEKGYTTKGKYHGRGLYEVAKSLKKNEIMKYKYEILDDYFIATLKINFNYKTK